MRIEEIHVEGYGVLSDRRFGMPGGLVCVHGDNESGKSTLLAFVRAVLFGFKKALTKQAHGVDMRTAAYDPVVGGRKGGSIVIRVDEGGQEVRYRVERVKVRSVDGELTVEDLTRGGSSRGTAAERLLARITGNTSEVVFSNVFAVGLDELHAVSSMQEDEVRSVLFTADAGVGPGFVGEMRRLEDRLEGLYKARGQKPELNRLLRKRDEVVREIRGARRDLSEYEGDRVRLAQLVWEEEEAHRERDQRVAQEQRAHQRIAAREHLGRLRELESAAQRLRQKPLPGPEVMKQVAKIQARLETNDQHLQSLEKSIGEATGQRDAIRFDEADAAAWEGLRELPRTHLMEDLNAANEADRYQKQIGELPAPHLDPAKRDGVRRLLEERDRLQKQIRSREDERLQLVTRVDGLRDDMMPEDQQMAAQRACRVDLESLHQKVDRAQQESQEVQERMTASLRELDPDWGTEQVSLAPVDATTVTRVANALPGEAVQDAPGTPGWVSVGAFIAGLALVLSGVALASFIGLLPLVLVVGAGLLLLGVAALIRGTDKKAAKPGDLPAKIRKVLLAYGLEGPVSRGDFQAMAARLQDARGALDRLETRRRRLEEAETELQEADRRIREAAELADVDAVGDLRDVARRLNDRLEQSRNASIRLRVTMEGLETVDAQVRQAETELNGSKKRLDALLDELGVPDETALLGLLVASEKREHLNSQMQRVGEGKRRFDYFANRFSEVLETLGETPPTRERFPVVVGAVYARTEEAFQAREKARELEHAIKKHRERYDQALEDRSVLERGLQEILGKHQVEDVAGLENLQGEARRLTEIDQSIQAKEEALGDLEANMPGLREEAKRIAPEEDQVLLAQSEEVKKDHQARVHELRERIHKLRSSLDRLDSSDSLGDLLSQKKAVDEELKQAREMWAELALTRFLLERARQEYEDKHGPEVLKRASEHVSHLTEGRYERLVASPDGSGHQLVSRSGRRVPAMPPHVSRGLFAQCYLFVRLAYSEVMQRDVPVPYVLDDVLSDFDEKRLSRAAEILNVLAGDRQVVLFTHHAHVAKAIEESGGTRVPFTQAAGGDTRITAPAVKSAVASLRPKKRAD